MKNPVAWIVILLVSVIVSVGPLVAVACIAWHFIAKFW